MSRTFRVFIEAVNPGPGGRELALSAAQLL